MLATTIHESNTTPHHQSMGRQHNHPNQPRSEPAPNPQRGSGAAAGLLPQSPIVCRWSAGPGLPQNRTRLLLHHTTTHYRQRRPPNRDTPHIRCGTGEQYLGAP